MEKSEFLRKFRIFYLVLREIYYQSVKICYQNLLSKNLCQIFCPKSSNLLAMSQSRVSYISILYGLLHVCSNIIEQLFKKTM